LATFHRAAIPAQATRPLRTTTPATSSGGVLTNDAHDGYSQYAEIAAPSAPSANTLSACTPKIKWHHRAVLQEQLSGTERDLSSTGGGGGSLNIGDGSTTVTDVSDLTIAGATIADDGGGAATLTITGGSANPYTDPTLQTFAWINQGGASEVVNGQTISLVAPAVSGYQNRIRKKAAPATPYIVTIAIQALYNPYATSNGYGFVFRESGSGKLSGIYFELSGGPTPYFYASKWTDHATYSATYGSNSPFYAGLPLWLRLADDGANRTMAWSFDGVNFLTIHSVGRTDFLTADEIGIMVDSNNASYGMTAMLLSWEES
jgi:hypothetical protein